MSSNMRDAMNEALVAFKREQSHPAMRELLERVAGCSAMSEVPDDRIPAVLAACSAPPVIRAAASGKKIDPARIYARYNNPPARSGSSE